MGTKRLPITDVSRVPRLDEAAAKPILQVALDAGVNLFDTSYTNHKGEAEAFLGDELSLLDTPTFVCTSYFDQVDPRFDYVLHKQLLKLKRDCIDFYTVEEVNDLTRMRYADSGALDFLFERKEAGQISCLGMSATLKPDNLAEMLAAYPWDFVRLRVSYYEWFTGTLQEQFEVAEKAGVPILAHAPMRIGAVGTHEPRDLAPLKEAAPERRSAEWSLLFAKTLEGVRAITCNAQTVEEMAQDVAVFADDRVLDQSELDVLAEVAKANLPAHKRR